DHGVDRLPWRDVDRSLLREDAELELLRKLSELPEVLQLAAEGLAPHRLTRYAEQVAAAFHRFYAECRVITEDGALSQARLCLIDGARRVLATTLDLVGVSAPESMER